MQGNYQEITWDTNIPRYAYTNGSLPQSLRFPLETLSVPVYYPGRYEVEKGERSGTSLTAVSIANTNTEERIRQEIALLGDSIYGKRGGKSGSGKSNGITTDKIKAYLDELGVEYGRSGNSKPVLRDLLLKRLSSNSTKI